MKNHRFALLFVVLASLTAFPCAVSIRTVTCDGVTDATAAINNELSGNALDGGGIVWLHGSCPLSGSLISTGAAVTLRGDGLNNTFILPSNSTFDAIVYNPVGITLPQGLNFSPATNATITIDGLSIVYPAVQNTGKYAIKLQAQAGACNPGGARMCINQPHITNVGIYNASRGILVYNAIGGEISNNVIMNFYGTTSNADGGGIVVDTPDSPDGGGLNIYQNAIVNYLGTCSTPAGNGIHFKSGGGIKIHHNGFACVFNGVYATIDGSSTQLAVDNNSYDTVTNTAFWLSRVNPPSPKPPVTFAQVSFSQNKCALVGGAVCMYVATDTKWLESVTVNANKVLGASNGNGSHFYLDAIDTLIVQGNTTISNGGSPVAYNIGSHTTNVLLGPNMKGGQAFSADAIPNPSQVTVLPGRP